MVTLLEDAVAHIKSGNIEKARPLLAEYLKSNPQDENAWLWMTRCVTEAEQKKYCFEKVLKINPQNQFAIRGLQQLSKPVSPPSTPQAISVQQPTATQKSRKSSPSVIILVAIGVVGFGIMCVCGIVWLFYPTTTSSSSPTQRTRPDYKQMLEANGFVYSLSDNEGNPSYVSPCGAVATVKRDAVGFAANHSSDNTCALEEIGAAISEMYPSEVFDCVVTSINLLNEYDQLITRSAVGYDISVSITEYENMLVIIVRDPR